MLFNSNFFMYVFLPTLILLYFTASGIIIVSKKLEGYRVSIQNSILLLFSIIFYLFTGGYAIIILFSVVLINYATALLVNKYEKKIIFIFGIFLNLAILFIFKYTNFLFENITFVFLKVLKTQMPIKFKIILPVGISFYIFQALSYLIDVYKKKVPVQRNFFRLFFYVSFFPQLVAGPIVRYESIEKQITCRKIDVNMIFDGACRFCLGLFKKVCFANLYGESVDKIFSMPFENITLSLSWSGLLLYSLQILFDFSAYSDMAIGLGKIFGFTFNENFEMPYTAKNITEFWRRWHISLSTFLRDYLYIPLGGNRKGNARTYINLFIVFAICGLWHGANYTFIIWGAIYGVLMIFERYLKHKFNFQMRGFWGNIVTFFIVTLLWLMFRAPSLSFAAKYFKLLFINHVAEGFYKYSYYVPNKTLLIAAIGFLVSFFDFKKVKLFEKTLIKAAIAFVMLITSMAFMADASFSPFIYFQF